MKGRFDMDPERNAATLQRGSRGSRRAACHAL